MGWDQSFHVAGKFELLLKCTNLTIDQLLENFGISIVKTDDITLDDYYGVIGHKITLSNGRVFEHYLFSSVSDDSSGLDTYGWKEIKNNDVSCGEM